MNIYGKSSRWKIYLAIVGLSIVVLSIFYTSFLARRLATIERNNMRFYVMAQEDLQDMDEEAFSYCDFTIQGEILSSNTTIPAIIVDYDNNVIDAINVGENRDSVYLQSLLDRWIEEGREPIPSFASLIYFGESQSLQQLRYFPVIQFLLIGAFIAFGYFGFNAARRAEQNRVWVGMAKETAHQLGTPISAIVAWVEHLKMAREEDPEVQEIIGELRNDVHRLELIADRFSKIGSRPNLQAVDIFDELDKCREYMEKRAPRKVSFDFPEVDNGTTKVLINPPLFDWVIENLIRNALDAMAGKGLISARVSEVNQAVHIDIIDTGKGIPHGKFKAVFRPGFTTKKRGWGLGLSLAKRIIEEYHGGRIYVKRSEEGKGTTFTIVLPKHQQNQESPVSTDERALV